MSPMINYQLYYERLRQGLEDCWRIATDNSITEENKVKMIRDVSRAFLDGEPTTADEYNKGVGHFLVRSKVDRRMNSRNKKE